MHEFRSVNPFNGESFARYPAFELSALDGLLTGMEAAQRAWGECELAERARHLEALARCLRARQDELAELASREMGKTLRESRAEVEKCALACEYYARHGAALLADREVETQHARSYYCHRPLGLLLAIMPWNFPYWQVFRFLAPALMAGNAVVLKHASNVPGCSLAIEDVVRRAGLPENLMCSLLVASRDAEALLRHPRVAGLSFTGSTDAGRRIAAVAGEEVRKCVLELGGSDAYVVLEDADLDAAVATCVASRLINNGQSCIAAKRFIVHTSLYGEFCERMALAMEKKRQGDPLDERSDLGPLARGDLCQSLAKQVEASLAAGARMLVGGRAHGNFYEPTVLGDVSPGMPAFDEELFGPVAAVIRAASEEEAVALANRSPFGLGAAVFTRDRERGERLARHRLEAGNCFVNAFVASDPRLPFGGIKASGYGRELGPVGITEFTNIKTVVID